MYSLLVSVLVSPGPSSGHGERLFQKLVLGMSLTKPPLMLGDPGLVLAQVTI